MEHIRIEQDHHGIAHLILDRHEGSANLMDPAFTEAFVQAVDQLETLESLTGVLVESTKTTFFAGGDLTLLSQVTEANAQDVEALLDSLKASFIRLERLGKPVVACLEGSALGGGFELALACHHRIALNHPKVKIGLPEVNLGLLPGAGGISRVTRLLGLEKAIPFLTEGRTHSVASAHAQGLIHELADSAEALKAQAIDWIKANPSPRAPWDEKGFKLPGGKPNSPKIAQMLSIAPAMILKKTQGCYPAANAILSAAVEGATLSIEAAGRIETRYFMPLALGPVSKSLIGTMFFGKNAIESAARKQLDGNRQFNRIGVVGAGMMGAGIAWACASKGLPVVLVDTEQSRAEQGKGYSERLVAKRFERGRLSAEEGTALLNRITPTESMSELAECDLVIEAVFEDRALKADVYQLIQSVVSPETIIASNTSTLPISSLAGMVDRPDQFIGLHFFSPVDKMPLLEIIRGEQTSKSTVNAALAFSHQITKTPIVVNDGRGFYTSRVFKQFTYEGMAMLAEGVPAAAIENAAWLAGYPVGPLAVSDEVTLTLMDRIRTQTRKDLETEGKTYQPHPGDAVIDRMLELNRVSKAGGAGFYEYPASDKKTLWPGLVEHFGGQQAVDVTVLKERFLFAQTIESLQAMKEGVVTSANEANIGSILGLGFPAWTGGALNYVKHWGRSGFMQRAEVLEAQYGTRFSVRGLESILKRL
ncbi:3-hydroxyacyl-CoA dehydrogenase NAD-binding domain-containing protein [Reinekea blandensis]|uniref:3-hydroxyacyl-CoA dehydrogenase n=1 Tax=Reinekea blandensis MED297 TaxID=314283 RepID=A4BGI3_9GAMM|nr:3-hydroxyacyl-CoA dehydrogenase NAD-binding domain-containing protein [Reinekea blandensis]EAR08789.1 3-hydroxyacyl-CoA dehydrogenase [Reinekea sp. MED297] [Reinekea blandensis MED297]